MGLDITAYRKLKAAPDALLDEDGYPLDWERFDIITQSDIDRTEKDFPGSTKGLKAGVYSFEATHNFKAGSYGGYNEWREELARMAHGMPAKAVWVLPPRADFAFQELINFTDCEGVIGPEVAAKLAKDFAAHQDRAEKFATTIADGEWFISRYSEWRKAFEMAADGGAVDFH